VNLMIDSASSAPQIAEFEVYNASGSVTTSSAASAAPTSSSSSAPSGGQTVTYEAENTTLYRGTVDNIHSGFSGSGFVDFENVNESYIEWTVNQAVAGNATASFRYANGTSAGRPLAISVNGTVINGSLAFNGTGAWSSWATQSIT